MSFSRSRLRGAVLALSLAGTALVAGACSNNRDAYGASSNQRHRWDRREDVWYRRWETNERLRHIAYERRRAEEQRAYWEWRREHRDDRYDRR